ncbi:hypothetical protein GDO86_005887 [Hymenochirus boettgeri]|uniref:Uncharacterized protein n=1 Tax=Hymenochirus boettgeri TaxID=247094 RepID=A0A8T2JBA8_9PIPI|nr:hypothetical protein GDO86_005887 [Hymenochirus boettgeri]
MMELLKLLTGSDAKDEKSKRWPSGNNGDLLEQGRISVKHFFPPPIRGEDSKTFITNGEPPDMEYFLWSSSSVLDGQREELEFDVATKPISMNSVV